MRLLNSIWYFVFLLLAGCSTNGLPEPDKDAFYKLYGNGTIQMATAMEFSNTGDVYIVGNQYVRNQDSSAVVLIHANAQGNQLWSRRYFGKGHNSSKSILVLPSNEVLILASTRESDHSASIPVLYRLNDKGDLISELFLTEGSASGPLSYVPEDMVLGEGGHVFLVGNLRGVSGVSQKSFIKKVDPATGEILDKREFSNSEMTEVRKVFQNGSKLLVVGNTVQEADGIKGQSIFVASFSPDLVEAQHAIVGSANNDTFRKAIVNSRAELLIISSEQSPNSTLSRGMISMLDNKTLNVNNYSYLDFSENEIPEAIAEDEDGNYFVAVNTIGERGRTNVIISKVDPYGVAIWPSPKEIGGEGSDKIAQVKIHDKYVYLLSTLDMQNENTLISLSRIKF